MIPTLSKEVFRQELFELFSEYVEPGTEISDRSTLFGDLGLDSVRIMEIVAKIEDRFGITFGESVLFGINTMKDVCRLVGDRLQEVGKLK